MMGAQRPVVAIVGRPNVGKSTLYNRLLGRPEAIVEEMPGTTRDRLCADLFWDTYPLTVMDTGGIVPRSSAERASDLAEQVQEQVQVAVAAADLLLFLVDVKDGVTALDEEVAQQLRRWGKPVLLVANKVDGERRALALGEFYSLGLGEPLAISAYHALGIGELMDRVMALLPPAPAIPEEGTQPLKVAIVGRPNVGKSQLLNTILGQERAIVSEVPGTTRDTLDILYEQGGQRFLLIDMAGIRRRGSIAAGIERYSVLRAERAIARADVAMVVLDMSQGVTAQDTHVAGYAWEAGKGVVVAANKMDLLPERARAIGWPPPEMTQRFWFIGRAPICALSALEGWGVPEALQAAASVGAARALRVSTGLLNRTLQRAVAKASPPEVHRRPWRLYYATQASAQPPTFVLFANYGGELPVAYRRFLENQLRDAFGFAGVPLKLVLRARGNEGSP